MTLNDIVNKIAEELTKKYKEEFDDTQPIFNSTNDMIYTNLNRERDLQKKGYEKATEVVRQTLYKIVSEEIKAQKLDFIL